VCGQAYNVCPFSTNERLRGKRKNRPDHVFPGGSSLTGTFPKKKRLPLSTIYLYFEWFLLFCIPCFSLKRWENCCGNVSIASKFFSPIHCQTACGKTGPKYQFGGIWHLGSIVQNRTCVRFQLFQINGVVKYYRAIPTVQVQNKTKKVCQKFGSSSHSAEN
jgi:hypothetical protein